jgi:hypothetical protein
MLLPVHHPRDGLVATRRNGPLAHVPRWRRCRSEPVRALNPMLSAYARSRVALKSLSSRSQVAVGARRRPPPSGEGPWSVCVRARVYSACILARARPSTVRTPCIPSRRAPSIKRSDGIAPRERCWPACVRIRWSPKRVPAGRREQHVSACVSVRGGGGARPAGHGTCPATRDAHRPSRERVCDPEG